MVQNRSCPEWIADSGRGLPGGIPTSVTLCEIQAYFDLMIEDLTKALVLTKTPLLLGLRPISRTG